jgi:hypothetical protein
MADPQTVPLYEGAAPSSFTNWSAERLWELCSARYKAYAESQPEVEIDDETRAALAELAQDGGRAATVKCPHCGVTRGTRLGMEYHLLHKVCREKRPRGLSKEPRGASSDGGADRTWECPCCSKLFFSELGARGHIMRPSINRCFAGPTPVKSTRPSPLARVRAVARSDDVGGEESSSNDEGGDRRDAAGGRQRRVAARVALFAISNKSGKKRSRASAIGADVRSMPQSSEDAMEQAVSSEAASLSLPTDSALASVYAAAQRAAAFSISRIFAVSQASCAAVDRIVYLSAAREAALVDSHLSSKPSQRWPPASDTAADAAEDAANMGPVESSFARDALFLQGVRRQTPLIGERISGGLGGVTALDVTQDSLSSGLWAAVSCSSGGAASRTQPVPASGPAVLQFWHMPLPTDSSSDGGSAGVQRSSRVYSIAHDVSTVHDLHWLPGSTSEERAAGVIAAAMGDGVTRVYLLPHPDAVREAAAKRKTATPSVFGLVPAAIAAAPGHAALSVRWAPISEVGGGARLLVGTLSGAVLVFDFAEKGTGSFGRMVQANRASVTELGFVPPPDVLTSKVSLLRLIPSRVLQASRNLAPSPRGASAVRCVAAAPWEPAIIASAHIDGYLRVWDLRSPQPPAETAVVANRANDAAIVPIISVDWAPAGGSLLVATGAGDSREFFYNERSADLFESGEREAGGNRRPWTKGIRNSGPLLELRVAQLPPAGNFAAAAVVAMAGSDGAVSLRPWLTSRERSALVQRGQSELPPAAAVPLPLRAGPPFSALARVARFGRRSLLDASRLAYVISPGVIPPCPPCAAARCVRLAIVGGGGGDDTKRVTLAAVSGSADGSLTTAFFNISQEFDGTGWPRAARQTLLETATAGTLLGGMPADAGASEAATTAAKVDETFAMAETSTIVPITSVDDIVCYACGSGEDADSLLLCDGCDRGCHMACCRPPLLAPPDGDWFCGVCAADKAICGVCGSGDNAEQLLLCDGCPSGACHLACTTPPLAAPPELEWFCTKSCAEKFYALTKMKKKSSSKKKEAVASSSGVVASGQKNAAAASAPHFGIPSCFPSHVILEDIGA